MAGPEGVVDPPVVIVPAPESITEIAEAVVPPDPDILKDPVSPA